MPKPVQIQINVGANTAGAAAAKVAIGQVGAEATKAEKQLLAYAQSAARLQSAQGNAAGAAQTLSSALAQVDRSSRQALAAEQQLTNANNALAKSASGASGGMAVLPRTIAGLSHEAEAAVAQFATLGGAIGVAAAAIGTAKKAFDLAEAGAQAQLVDTRFQALAATAHTTGAALLGALRAASGNEISDLNLQLAANKAQLLGVAHSAEEFGVLMGIARDRAQQMGISTTQAFDDLVTGLGRGSRLILDNLGIIVNADAANQAYAASIGKTVAALTDEERKQALINQVLKDGAATMAATGGAVDSNAQSFARAGAAWENAKNSLGTLLSYGFTPILNSFSDMVEGGQAVSSWFSQLGTASQQSAAEMAAAAAANQAYATTLQATGDAAQAAQSYEVTYAATLAATAAAAAGATDIEQHRVDVLNAGAAIAQQAQAAQLNYAASLEMAGIQARAAAMAAEQKANADQVAAVDAQTHAIAQQQLAEQAMNAARALLAAGPAGANTAALLAGSSQQVDILTAAYYRLFAAQQAVGASAQKAKARKDDFAERHGGIEGGDLTPGARARAAKEIALNQQINDAKKKSDLQAAQDAQTLAVGTAAQKQAILQREYDTAVKQHGAMSAEAVNAQTKLLQAQQAGSSARASAAGAAATKLEGIETKTGDKLSQIVQDTQAKLIAIDQKAAAERAKIAADLANKIATTAADRRAANEADDLELIGVTDEKQAQALNDRERAQAAAREREVAAAKEAQELIANGEAETASKVYDIREKQIGDQQALDEKYAERQRELAGNDEQLAALKQQYDEATRANTEAAQTRIDIAKAESAQKAAEVQAEKDAVIAAANEQANSVVAAAERSATGVKNASASARTTAVANLKAIGDAVTAIPASKTITITVKQDGTVGASSSGSSPTGRASGGDTNVGRVTLVGERGPELVVFDTPGRVYPAGQTKAMLKNGAIPGLANGGLIDAGGGYTTPIAGAGPTKSGGSSKGKKGGPAAIDPKKALDEMKNTIQLLMDMAKLKEQIADLAGVPAFDIPTVQALIARAQEFTQAVNSHLVPITKAEGESLGRYLSAAKDAVSLISDMVDLKKDVAELKNVPAFDQPTVLALIDRAQQFTAALQSHLIPLTEFERDQFSRYASVVGDTVGILSDMSDLKKELAEPSPPINTDYIWQLVADAAAVTIIMRERLVATSEEQADAIGQYASAAGDTISILNDVLDLGKALKENGAGAISDQLIIRLADQAKRITEIVQARLIPITKEQGEAVSAYADAVGASVSALKDVADLGGKLFTDYTSPTDAQIALLATDAKRITDGFFAAGALLGKEGAEAGKAYAEGVGAAFSAAKDGLLVIDALKSGDFVLPEGALAQFQGASLQILDVMQALGARAAALPAGDIAALQGVTSAISGQAEALIKLAAVPFGDLGSAAQSFGQSGGALGNTTIYNTFNLPAGSNQQTAQEVIRLLNQQMGARR